MRLIVGLGNPGREYDRTRHNIGFMVADELYRRFGAPGFRTRFKGLVAEGMVGTEKVILLKPLTFMNLSGQSVSEALRWYHLDNDDVLIMQDDLDLPFAALRLRARGTPGGHNGMASIIQLLATNEVSRLKIGIGRGSNTAHSHVLGRFTSEQEAELPFLLMQAADTAELWVREGIAATMNKVNMKATVGTGEVPGDKAKAP